MFDDTSHDDFDPLTFTRPDGALLWYYLIISVATLVFFPFMYIPRYIRFKTMRYRFDDTGVSMQWGFFFRKEVHLTYRRLQDIHVTRNLIERWMGLAKVPIQTASGTTGATMKIEGIREPEKLRDYLYVRMRGARADTDKSVPEDGEREVTQLLVEIRDAIRNRNSTGSNKE